MKTTFWQHTLLATALTVALTACNDDDDNIVLRTTSDTIEISQLGRYDAGVFGASAAEIVAYDPATQRVFVVNANRAAVEVLDINDPANPTLLGTLQSQVRGATANSVSVKNGLVAIAVEAANTQAPGTIEFYNATDLTFQGSVPVGALPDMVIFTPDGNKVLVANEGEPNDEYTVDPEGSVSIIDVSNGVASATVRTATFTAYNTQQAELVANGLRVFGPGASLAQDMEPEYIAVSADSQTAWVSLQENNALAVVDIDNATISSLVPLGFKDHSVAGNELDASDRDEQVNIRNWPVFGMYQPDTIAAVSIGGADYIITANEGDSRDYDGFSEETRVSGLTLDPTAFPDADTLQGNSNLGRLETTTTLGDTDGDGDYDQIYSYGARSFSIWDSQGNLVFDSGSEIERKTADIYGINFNNDNDENAPDGRSDAKGPEPEALTVGVVDGKTYAFIGLERMGGIMVYDISTPTSPSFVQYLNERNLDLDPEEVGSQAGDLGPEGMAFITAEQSPNGKPIVVVGNEISGTTVLYQVNVVRR